MKQSQLHIYFTPLKKKEKSLLTVFMASFQLPAAFLSRWGSVERRYAVCSRSALVETWRHNMATLIEE